MEDLTSSEKLRSKMIKGFFLKLSLFSAVVLILDASVALYIDNVSHFIFDLIYIALIGIAYFILEVKKNTDLAIRVTLFGCALIQPLNVYEAGGLFTLQSLWLPIIYLVILSVSVGRYQSLAPKLLVGGVSMAIVTSYFFNPENAESLELSAIQITALIFFQLLFCWGIDKFRIVFSDTLNSQVKIEEREEVLKAAIVTYNHEVRNPLTIAKGYLEVAMKKEKDLKELSSISEALVRVEDVLNSIEKVKIHSIEYETYDGSIQMLKIKK